MHDLRKLYTHQGLYESDMLDDPIEQLRNWFDEALKHVPAEWFETGAAMLATSSSDGQVTARMILLKGIDSSGLLFFTNYDSPKARQLAENPRAALVVHWPHLGRQVRIEGVVERVARDVSVDYFRSRPRGSQISAAISPQSDVVRDRAELEQWAATLEGQLAGGDVPVPENWGGYRLAPNGFEFWQGRDNRLHDRFRYRQSGGRWLRERLAP